MMATLKINGALLDRVRADLARPHPHAYERVGFLTAGACTAAEGNLLVLTNGYVSVDDEDYEINPRVGAAIGRTAFRKALEVAHRTRSSLLHVHSHGRRGLPGFSKIDLVSGVQFVPSFFSVIPAMPHGMVVLSDTHATGLVWSNAAAAPTYFSRIARIGTFITTIGGRHEQV